MIKRLVLVVSVCLTALLISSCGGGGTSSGAVSEDYFRNNLIHKTLTNSFQGTLNSSGKDQPAVTSFFIENGGKIAGNYIFYECSYYCGIHSGDLYDCNILDIETLKCTWKDDWGDGVFLVIFSEDFNSFNGYWSDYDYMNNKYNWNGKR